MSSTEKDKKEVDSGYYLKVAENNVVVEEDEERAQWGSFLQFFLTVVGYSVGLGNVWRFPYLTYRNGGGAFLVPYILMLIFVGIPIFYLEMYLGQFTSLGPTGVWTINPIMKGVGIGMVIINTVIALYYNVIISWSVFYFFASMYNPLPWSDCNNWWNTENCYLSTYLSSACVLNRETAQYLCNVTNSTEQISINTSTIVSPSEEYYYNYVLRISDSMSDLGNVRWQLACCLLLCWIIVFFVLLRGISSLGNVVYFSTSFPYILLTIMVIRGVTLPGADDGIEYYLRPDWSRLSDVQVWSDAVSQIFYGLSACTGGLIAMASYNPFTSNMLRDSIMVPTINVLTSIFAGFAIFPVLGFLALQKGVTVDDVADDGPGLVFVTYPEALTQMTAAPVWSMLFFFMLITLGFSSEFSMVECCITAICDEYSFLRAKSKNMLFRLCICISFYLISLPMVTEGGFYIFSLVDYYIGGFPLLFVGIFETTLLAYVYGFYSIAEDIVMMIGVKPNWYFWFSCCFLTPAILSLITLFAIVDYQPYTLFDGSYVYSDTEMILAWVIVGLPLVFIPGVFVYRYCKDGGWALLVFLSSPTPAWGPAKAKNRTGRYRMLDNQLRHEELLEEFQAKVRQQQQQVKANYKASYDSFIKVDLTSPSNHTTSPENDGTRSISSRSSSDSVGKTYEVTSRSNSSEVSAAYQPLSHETDHVSHEVPIAAVAVNLGFDVEVEKSESFNSDREEVQEIRLDVHDSTERTSVASVEIHAPNGLALDETTVF